MSSPSVPLVPFFPSRPLTIRHLVECCGGPSAVARALGVSRRQVHRWMLADRIPREYGVEAMLHAKRKGFAWHPPDLEPAEVITALAFAS